MARKFWNVGDQLNASDLNGNFKNGGTGADGALSISSGTTTLNTITNDYLEKNYTSVSITGTAVLAFTTLDTTRGTSIALRSQGALTITSSAARAIDLRNAGGSFNGGTGGSTTGSTAGGAGGGGAAALAAQAATAAAPVAITMGSPLEALLVAAMAH